MNNLSILPVNTGDNFIIDDLIKDDPDIYLHSDNPELQCSKFLFGITKIESEMERCRKNAQSMIDEINFWLEGQISKRQKQIDFMANFCRNYLAQNDIKSLNLPAGNIGFRKQPEKIEISDADLFFEKATFDLIRVVPEKFEPDLTAIKSRIKDKGTIPPGVSVVSLEPKFYYKLNKKSNE